MADASTELKIRLSTPGAEKLPGLARSFQKFGFDVKRAGLSVTKLGLELKKQQATGIKSINNTRALSNTWKELANSVEFGSRAFRVATARAARLDKELAKMQGRKGVGGRFGTGAKIGGTIAAAGVFGGPAGVAGAAIGGAIGGLPGAIAGGTYGAIAGGTLSAIGETAAYSAALSRQRKALRLVIADTRSYREAQSFLSETSKKLAIPQDVIVRQFTALTASVKGAGHSVEDAEKVFESIASGIRGTGGSLEDMRAAMVATAQVFSKGKVSAEELRQQLGERLPGAFTIFAKSMRKTPAELDKALEQGKVTLNDFMKFSETLFAQYGENAKILAQGPEAAGDRMTTAMSVLKDEVGKILQPLGAQFQDWSTSVVEAIGSIIKEFNKLFGIGDENKLKWLEKQLSFWKGIQEFQEKVNTNLKRLPGGDFWGLEGTAGYEGVQGFVGALESQIESLKQKIKESTDETNNLKNAVGQMGQEGESIWTGMKNGALAYRDSVKSISVEIADVTKAAFKSMEDQLVNFVTVGTFEFKKFAQSVINDLIRIYIRQAMVASISGGGPLSFLGGLFGGGGKKETPLPSTGFEHMAAKGNVYANGIKAFARGGIVSNPTLFRFANGTGLMGEAGPEAIMPLRRGPGGRLGVEAAGGGTNVVINVDASGSSVEGDDQSARQLGSAISAAVQQQLVKERRPGGLLYA